tara:strand:+ start:92 stop:574 length:483 start_codon:yes stop_codon:yes gene_type:complete
MGFVFIAGIICFACYSFSQDFLMGTIILSLSLLFVNIYGLAARSISSKAIFYLFSISMVLVAISVFGNYGVEQKPVGYQTLYHFNLEGVAASLMLLLLSSLLLIAGNNQNQNLQTQIHPSLKRTLKAKPKKTIKNIIESDDWQEASIEDIRSGQYQIHKP